MTQPIHIIFPIYSGVTQLDFTGPFQVFSRAPGFSTQIASVGGRAVEADGLQFTGLAHLEDIEKCDVLCVPGGSGVTEALQDEIYMAQIRRLASTARYLTSVCSGSLVLGAAGLLRNRHAACHWAWRDMLGLFGAIPDAGRVVRDGNILTGGGVTAGIDFALTLVSDLLGADTAQVVQLGLEYAPAPPFNAGRPDTAPPEILARVQARNAQTLPPRRAIVESIAAALLAAEGG